MGNTIEKYYPILLGAERKITLLNKRFQNKRKLYTGLRVFTQFHHNISIRTPTIQGVRRAPPCHHKQISFAVRDYVICLKNHIYI